MNRTTGYRAVRCGFTLVEMLVVLGIITLLASILLPALTAARRAANNTKCLSNLRQIGMAVSQFMAENNQTIPPGVSSNGWDDPASSRGAYLRPPPYQAPDYFQWPASSLPVAYYLDGYLKYDLRIWQCPGARVVRWEPVRKFRPGQMVQSVPTHSKNDLRIWDADAQWRPGYMYLSTSAWGWYRRYQGATWSKYFMEDWAVRSVAGRKPSDVKTMSLQPASEIVLFFDYNSTQHSKAVDDVYDLPNSGTSPSVRGKFQSNFLYLDGHAETRRYTWQGSLLNAIHRPFVPDSYATRQQEVFHRQYSE